MGEARQRKAVEKYPARTRPKQRPAARWREVPLSALRALFRRAAPGHSPKEQVPVKARHAKRRQGGGRDKLLGEWFAARCRRRLKRRAVEKAGRRTARAKR
jgi:hypothetical protein